MDENVTSEENSPVHNVEYASEAELMSEFYNYMSDPTNVETAANYLFHSLLDEIILGVVFEIHYSIKTGISDAVEGEPEDNKQFTFNDLSDIGIFDSTNTKKTVKFSCPNCERTVGSAKFAKHLGACMGMGRNSGYASRQVANSEEGTASYFAANVSDDDDDADWSSEKRKRKLQTARANGNKKNGKSS